MFNLTNDGRSSDKRLPNQINSDDCASILKNTSCHTLYMSFCEPKTCLLKMPGGDKNYEIAASKIDSDTERTAIKKG